MGKKDNHIHRYERKPLGNKGYKIFKCMVPGCTHYIDVKMGEGRICECNRCHKPFVLDRRAMKLAKPHCLDCVEKTSDDRKIEERIKALGL